MSIVYKHGRSEVCLPLHTSHSVDDIYQFAANVEGLSRSEFYLTFNGKYIQSDDTVTCPCHVRFHLRLPGGKGGFGSMLRAIGARIEKTTNHEACRDLSGRRMRDVNNEKQIAEWVSSKDTQEEERKQKRIAKLERIINPKHNYEDRGYTSNLQDNADKINDALQSALSKRDKRLDSKRKLRDGGDDDVGNQKKNRMWIGVDDDDDSDGSDSDCFENIVSVGEQPCSSKSCMNDSDLLHCYSTSNEKHDSSENKDFEAGDQNKTIQDVKGNGTTDEVTEITNTYIASSTADIASHTANIDFSIANIDSSPANITSTTADIASTTADIASTTADIASTTADIASTTADIASTTANIASTTANIASTTANIDSSTADIAPSTASVSFAIAAVGSTTANIVDTPSNGSKNNSSTNNYVWQPCNSTVGSTTANIVDTPSNGSENNRTTNNYVWHPCNSTVNISETTTENKPIDLNEYSSAQHLEAVGLDRLKFALMAIGLKCGGTLQERAQRLFITKNTPLYKLDPSLFSKGSKGKMKKRK